MEAEASDDADRVIVIGTGFGGAVTACRLAQAGFKVLILERGRRYEAGDFPNLPTDSTFAGDTRRWSYGADQGLWDVIDLDEIVSVQAAGYGGGSLVYANVHLRPPSAVFDAAWPLAFQKGELDPYFNLAACMLDVAPITEHPQFHNIAKASQMSTAAKDLGKTPFYPPLAIRHRDTNGPQPKLGCSGCGACCTGCPQGSKNTLDHNYLAIAESYPDTQVVTQCEVLELVETESGWLVRCFDHLEARQRNFDAKCVFLCAGAVHSTRLMAGASFRTPAGMAGKPRDERRTLQKRIGTGYFPGGDALGIVYDTTQPQKPTVGPVISTAVAEWSSPRDFVMIQDGGYPEPIERLVGVLRASTWLERNKLTDSLTSKPRKDPKPDPQNTFGTPSHPLIVGRYASAADDVLSAAVTHSFDKIVPAQLRDIKDAMSHRASLPLLLSSVVGQTIEGGIRSRLPPLGFVRNLFVFGGKLVARVGLGSNQSLAERALHALFEGAYLSPKDLAMRIANYDGENRQHRAVFLAMGRDSAVGALHYHRSSKRLTADLNLKALAPGYTKQEGLMVQLARKLGGELRTNPTWEFLRKPITVHSQGGCGMSDDPSHGVTDSFGKVHGHDGLYVLDGSVLCHSVGVNPSATIAAIAERGVLNFIQSKKGYAWPDKDKSAGAGQYRDQQTAAANWRAKAARQGWNLSPPQPSTPSSLASPMPIANPGQLDLSFTENLKGYYSQTSKVPRDDAQYLELETKGRPENSIELSLTLGAPNLKAFFEDPDHRLEIRGGTITFREPGGDVLAGKIRGGEVQLFVPKLHDSAISASDHVRLNEQLRVSGGMYRAMLPREQRLHERLMIYTVEFQTPIEHGVQKQNWALHGYKRIARTATKDAWRQTSTLFVLLLKYDQQWASADMSGAGAVHVELTSFLYDQIPSTKVTTYDHSRPPNGQTPLTDARTAWALGEFATFFFGSLQRMYLPAAKLAQHRTMTRRRALRE